MIARRIVPCLVALLLPQLAFAETAGAPHLDGADLNLWWALPFAGILLSIALVPLFSGLLWHHHFGKVAGFWVLAFLAPFTVQFGFGLALYEVVHTVLLEYLPFLILVGSLFVVAGGIRVTGYLRGTPGVNTLMLLIGTLLASVMGTTGAAMLMIRPMIRANAWRTARTHVFVFFIFLVANIGGSLTPLGDPPLFLGFLKGVPFFWPTTHMLGPMALCSLILLGVFFLVDKRQYSREPFPQPPPQEGEKGLGIEGGVNLVLLAGIVAAVLMSGLWQPGISFTIFHVELELQQLVRDLLLIGIAALSLKATSAETRTGNGFSWFPIKEVATLFAAIFLTIIPVIAMLRAGLAGPMGGIIAAVSRDGQPVNAAYFWASGLLSSFLDNAPTYLVFFNTAGGDPAVLTTQFAQTLLAISAGSVFMGANTYIGNAPNFMVRSIVEEQQINMPSFFGYMAWSILYLIPTFLLVTWVFFL